MCIEGGYAAVLEKGAADALNEQPMRSKTKKNNRCGCRKPHRLAYSLPLFVVEGAILKMSLFTSGR